jgi:hypothetical protein
MRACGSPLDTSSMRESTSPRLAASRAARLAGTAGLPSPLIPGNDLDASKSASRSGDIPEQWPGECGRSRRRKGSEPRRVLAAEEEAVAAAVLAAKADRARAAGESTPEPACAVRKDPSAGKDGGVAVAGENHTAGRVHRVAVTPGETASGRFVRARPEAAANVAAEAGRRTGPAGVDAADVPGRGADRGERGLARPRRTGRPHAEDRADRNGNDHRVTASGPHHQAPNAITLRMPSCACMSSKPRLTSSSESVWEMSGSTSMSPAR